MRFLVLLCCAFLLVACEAQHSTDETTVSKTNKYNTITKSKLVKCLGQPTRTLKTDGQEYYSYITANRCDAIFTLKDDKVVDVEFRMPHIYPLGMKVKHSQCHIANEKCLIG
ncbi:MAG: hypothetical protein CMF50_00555 [Legionellales bacterium]|nr:hypothetical protein [Legionellales bacterium]|tara:strand:+ start:18295 stop:18630 length:336 start_codon:yes stop_codon:yes gene_type:complete